RPRPELGVADVACGPLARWAMTFANPERSVIVSCVVVGYESQVRRALVVINARRRDGLRYRRQPVRQGEGQLERALPRVDGRGEHRHLVIERWLGIANR